MNTLKDNLKSAFGFSVSILLFGSIATYSLQLGAYSKFKTWYLQIFALVIFLSYIFFGFWVIYLYKNKSIKSKFLKGSMLGFIIFFVPFLFFMFSNFIMVALEYLAN